MDCQVLQDHLQRDINILWQEVLEDDALLQRDILTDCSNDVEIM